MSVVKLSGVKFLSLLLSLFLVFSLVPGSVFAGSHDFVKLENTNPADKAINVPVDVLITVTFSKSVKEGPAFHSAIKVSSKGDYSIDIEKSIDNNVLTLEPKSDLSPDTTYKVLIPAGVLLDMDDRPLAQAYIFSFSTGSMLDDGETGTDPGEDQDGDTGGNDGSPGDEQDGDTGNGGGTDPGPGHDRDGDTDSNEGSPGDDDSDGGTITDPGNGQDGNDEGGTGDGDGNSGDGQDEGPGGDTDDDAGDGEGDPGDDTGDNNGNPGDNQDGDNGDGTGEGTDNGTGDDTGGGTGNGDGNSGGDGGGNTGGGGGGSSGDSQPPAVVVMADKIFSDIPSDFWCRESITRLIQLNIVNGYPDGTFKPNGQITRAEFTKMVVLAMGWKQIIAITPSFTDMSDGHWAGKYIEAGVMQGVIHGYKDGEFKSEKNISRAEIAKIIAMTLNLESGVSSLTDIESNWAKDHINACVKAGIIHGYPNNAFRPNNPATRAEAAKMIVKMLDIKQ